MKNNEIGGHAECRRKVKTYNLWLDKLKKKKSVFIHSVYTTLAELTSFEERMKRRSVGETIISTAK